jgi:hypothetical protein
MESRKMRLTQYGVAKSVKCKNKNRRREMEKKLSIWALVLILSVLIISGCKKTADVPDAIQGSGNIITEDRAVSNFDRIDWNGSGDVAIIQSGEESLTVEADDNVIEYVRTEVKNGTLELGLDAGEVKSISSTRLRFRVNVKDLTGLNLFGSGHITAASLDTDRLDIAVTGSGEVQIDSLTTEQVEVRITGSGRVRLVGEVAGQDIDISGSGEYHGGDLRAETVEITISGSGDSTVWATESLDVRINGSGSLDYYGSPTVNRSGSGSGELNDLGEK